MSEEPMQDPTLARVKDIEQALLAHKHLLKKAQAQRDALQGDLLRVTEERNAARESRRALEFELGLLRDEPAEKRLAATTAERDALQAQLSALAAEVETGARLCEAERQEHAAEVAELERTVESAFADHSRVEAERARLARENEGLREWQVRVADTLGLVSRAEGQSGCEVADVDATVSAIRKMNSDLDTARGQVRWYIERAADEKLDGYRELGARAAAAENAADTLRAQLSALAAEHESAARSAEERIKRLMGALLGVLPFAESRAEDLSEAGPAYGAVACAAVETARAAAAEATL